MNGVSRVRIRPARSSDVAAIVAMLADDALGRGRERIEDPLPPSYLQAFEKVERDPNIQLVVAEGEGGEVIGCLQLCILPGLSSQGASRGLIEDVRVASHYRKPRHRRTAGAMGRRGGAIERLQIGRAAHAQTRESMRSASTNGWGFQASHVGMTIRF